MNLRPPFFVSFRGGSKFFFGVLSDEGVQATLQGRFSHSQLITCKFDGVTWKRHAGESAEQFERRETENLREMLCVVQPSKFVESEAAQATAAADGPEAMEAPSAPLTGSCPTTRAAAQMAAAVTALAGYVETLAPG